MEATSQNSDTSLAPSNTSGEDADIEAKAREMGWRPEAEFKGPKDHFVDAKTFYERGKTVLPIIQAENRALRDELARVGNDARKALEIADRAHEREVADLQAQLEAAKVAREEAVTNSDGKGFTEADKLVKDLEAEVDKSAKPPKNDVIEQRKTKFMSWLNRPENSWLRDNDEAKLIADGFATYTKYGPIVDAQGLEAGWDAIAKDVKKVLEARKLADREDLERPGPERGGRGSGEVKGGNGTRSFTNLTPEFQKECDRQYKSFYGGSKTITLEKWRERYVSGIAPDAFRK